MARQLSSRREQQLVRAARKRLRKKGAKDRPAAKQMKIQVVAPWKRWSIALVGFVFLGIAVYLFGAWPGAALVFFILFILTVLLAWLGSKKTIEEALNGLDSAVTGRVIDAIFDGLF